MCRQCDEFERQDNDEAWRAHDSAYRPSPAMFAAMQCAADEERGLSPCHHGASTIAALKRLGWIAIKPTTSRGRIYELSATGRAALKTELERPQATRGKGCPHV